MAKAKTKFSSEFKSKILSRVVSGEEVSKLAKEYNLSRHLIYKWKHRYHPELTAKPGKQFVLPQSMRMQPTNTPVTKAVSYTFKRSTDDTHNQHPDQTIQQLKVLLADLMMENQRLKESRNAE